MLKLDHVSLRFRSGHRAGVLPACRKLNPCADRHFVRVGLLRVEHDSVPFKNEELGGGRAQFSAVTSSRDNIHVNLQDADLIGNHYMEGKHVHQIALPFERLAIAANS